MCFAVVESLTGMWVYVVCLGAIIPAIIRGLFICTVVQVAQPVDEFLL